MVLRGRPPIQTHRKTAFLFLLPVARAFMLAPSDITSALRQNPHLTTAVLSSPLRTHDSSHQRIRGSSTPHHADGHRSRRRHFPETSCWHCHRSPAPSL